VIKTVAQMPPGHLPCKLDEDLTLCENISNDRAKPCRISIVSSWGLASPQGGKGRDILRIDTFIFIGASPFPITLFQ
jgi:hypothetical protein